MHRENLQSRYDRDRAGNSTQAVKKPPEIGQYLNTIICGDAADVLASLPDTCVDLIVTSPPYNFGHHYAGDPSGDARDWNDYFTALGAVWRECYRVLKPGGRIAVNIQPLFSEYTPTHHLISQQLMDLGLLWKTEILWEKHNYNAKYTAWGSWKSPSMPYLKYTWEFIEVFDKETHKKAGRREDIDITAVEFKEWIIARWSFPPETKMKDYGHPAMFPEELPRRVMKLFSYRGDVVLDPFNGVGTTSVVACKNGRPFIGIDISADYCRTAMTRLRAVGGGRHICKTPPPRFIKWKGRRRS
jgi:DNA modification methylase